jgi:hypothetical protein
MFRMNLKHSLATVAVAAGLLAGAGSAGAGAHQSEVISYNGHAGLGASAYQHDQTDLEFLTSWATGARGSGASGSDRTTRSPQVSRTGLRTRSCSESAR